MPREARRYLSYLVRLWDEGAPGTPRWRASIEDPDTGERRGFADLTRLFAFIKAETCADAASDRSTDRPNDER
jgi:hypothetical protein